MAIIDIPTFIFPSLRASGTSGSDQCTLDAAEEFICLVLTVPKSGTLNKIGWQAGTTVTASGFVLKISVETVATTVGQPVATTNAGKTLYVAGAESADITTISSGAITYTPINGSTGISVTVGDKIAITFRLVSITSGALTIMYQQYPTSAILTSFTATDNYTALYLGSSWTTRFGQPILSLVYSDGFLKSPIHNPPCVLTLATWNSGSNPDRRGMKFRLPYKFRLYGLICRLGYDSDTDIILYDSDEYTVMSGFPITLTNTRRGSLAVNYSITIFTTKPTLEANTWYRLVFLPKSSTNITSSYSTMTDDGSYVGIDATVSGQNSIWTSFNGTPSSGSHSWTDENYHPHLNLIIDGIDIGAAAGGLLRHPGMQGGLNA